MATSTLNPNAPLFIPLSYRTVEDFSDRWWDLVHSSPSFRNYWVSECYTDCETDPLFTDFTLPDVLDSCFFDFDACINKDEVEMEEKDQNKDLVSMGMMKWQKGRAQIAELPKFVEKAPRIVNVRVSPRTIQQPR